MKKTFRKDTYRNIGKRIVSWLSIATILFIGFSGILGVHYASYSMELVGDGFFKEHNCKDFDMTSTLAVKKSEVERISKEEGVLDAEGVISISGILNFESESSNVTLISMTDRISVPYRTEGELPKEKDECGIPVETAKKLGISIGDSISLSVPSKRFEKILDLKEYKVVGFVYHPDYIVSGKDDYVILPLSSFNTESLAMDYTNVFVDADVPKKISSMKNEYYTAIGPAAQGLEELTGTLSKDRIQNIQKELDDEYEKSRDEAYEQLADARKEIDDSRRQFEDEVSKARKELDDVIKELEDGKAKANEQIASGKKKIEDGEKEYEDMVTDGQAQLDKAQKDMEDELALNKWKLFDGYLQIDQAEKTLNEKEAEYKAGLEKLLSGKEQLENGWNEYNYGLNELDKGSNTIIDNIIDGLNLLLLITTDPAEIAMIQGRIDALNGAKGKDPIDKGNDVLGFYDSLGSGTDAVIKGTIDAAVDMSDYRNKINSLSDAKALLDQRDREYEAGKAGLEEARAELDRGWFSLGQKKTELADGEAEYARREPEARKQLEDATKDFENKKADGAKQLEDAKAEFEKEKASALSKIAEAEKQIEDGQKELDEEIEKGESELKKAEEKYESKKAEVEENLAEAKKEIDSAKNVESRWVVQSRKANLHFLRLTSSYEVLAAFFIYFSPLYCALVVLVCFFTLVIIVEEQRTEIGVSKAFGLYKSEIRKKYTTFGITAALTGEAIGIVGSVAIEYLFEATQAQDYIFGILPLKIELIPTLIMAVGSLLLTIIAAVLSCEKLLSGPAVGLINGTFPEKKSLNKSSNNSGGSLYAKLIIRNALTDSGRVVVSITIILLCCFMMGLGFTARNALNQAIDRQISDIWKYDIKVTKTDNITQEQEKEIEKLLDGYESISVYNYGVVIQTDDDQTLAEIFAVDDDDKLFDFYAIKDKKGKRVSIPEEGLLVTQEMREKNKMTTGTKLTMTDNSLRIRESDVKGEFVQYFEHCCIMTKDYYRELFDTEAKENTYLVKTGSEDFRELAQKLEEMDGIFSIGFSDDIKTENRSLLLLYDVLVAVIIMFAILLCFMILLNLSNILVLHRMRELLTMRVNGFSGQQVVGYLAKETIFTTVIGAVLGIISGVPGSAFIVRRLEANAVMFVREHFPIAWILSTILCFVFAAVINAIAFRKVVKTPLTDVNKFS